MAVSDPRDHGLRSVCCWTAPSLRELVRNPAHPIAIAHAFPAATERPGLALPGLFTPGRPRGSLSWPRDPPGPPLAHPPLVLRLLVVVFIVTVVPPPGGRGDHSPGLPCGVVGAVFCTGAGETGMVASQHARSPAREVRAQPPDRSRGCAHPLRCLPFPTLLATTGTGPPESDREGPGGHGSCTRASWCRRTWRSES